MPSPTNNAAAVYKGPVKIELLKDAVLLRQSGNKTELLTPQNSSAVPNKLEQLQILQSITKRATTKNFI